MSEFLPVRGALERPGPEAGRGSGPRACEPAARVLDTVARALCIFSWLAFASAAEAASTGSKTAATAVNPGLWTTFTAGAGGTLTTSENTRANSAALGSNGVVSTFGFGVPAGSTISGITVLLEGRSNPAGPVIATLDVELSWDGGTNWTAKASTVTRPEALAVPALGSVADTWGHAWTSAELSDAAFQLRVRWTGGAGVTSMDIDQIQVAVEYLAPPTATSSPPS